MKENANDRDAVVGLRFNVLDVIDRGRQRSLTNGDDALFHLLRRNSHIAPHQADHRYVNVRENVRRHDEDRDAAKNRDQYRHNNEGVGPAKGKPDNPHTLKLLDSEAGSLKFEPKKQWRRLQALRYAVPDLSC